MKKEERNIQRTTSIEGTPSCGRKVSPASDAASHAARPADSNDAPEGKSVSKTSPSWNDWHWQIKNRIRNVVDLKHWFPETDTSGISEAVKRFPMAITPYYASLIKSFDGSDPVFKMSVPQIEELIEPQCLMDDPLEEDADMPLPGLIHRYPDRALLIATTMCSMYCRHCTRKRVAGQRESSISAARLRQTVAYLEKHPEIRDVIISGGDPLTMETTALDRILSAIRSVKSIDIIRIGTRVPVVMPMRVNNDLVEMIRKYHPLYINTHFNHPNELTEESAQACRKLADAGIPLGNQTVLLRGINDNPRTMEELCRGLVKMRVRPYYVFQCDLVRGIEHFRTPVSRGIEIMEYLRGRLSGLAIPLFVVDAPHGGGKIPVSPNYVVSMSPTHTVLRNFEGMFVAYPEPSISNKSASPKDESAPGVWELSTGQYSKIQPQQTIRHQRRRIRPAESAAEDRSKGQTYFRPLQMEFYPEHE